MTTPEGRPRPQYGEYATPEEQLAHIKDPPPHMLEQHPGGRPGAYGEANGMVPPVVHPGGDVDASAGSPGSHRQAGVPGAQQRATSHALDRVATLALLALGLYSVLSTLVTMTDLPTYLDHTMEQMGMGSFTATPTAGVIAAVISGVNIVVWVAAAAFSTLSLRKGRISFWIPLVAGVAVALVTGVCYAVLLMGDPSFIDYVSNAA